MSGTDSGVQLTGCCPGTGGRRGLSRVPLHRLWKRTHQETSHQPRRFHTDQSTTGILQGNTQKTHKKCTLVDVR